MVESRRRKKILAILAGCLAGVLVLGLVLFLLSQVFGSKTVQVYSVGTLATAVRMDEHLQHERGTHLRLFAGNLCGKRRRCAAGQKGVREEGQSVKKGDPLLEYDVSLLSFR